MNELAGHASNDTNMDAVDREAMQAEMDALIEEIDDIAGRTEFNTQNLLGGEFKDKVFHLGANKGQSIEDSIEAMNAEAIGVEGLKINGQAEADAAMETIQDASEQVT